MYTNDAVDGTTKCAFFHTVMRQVKDEGNNEMLQEDLDKMSKQGQGGEGIRVNLMPLSHCFHMNISFTTSQLSCKNL